MNGIINIYKPQGFTSFDIVAIVRKHLNIKRVGHTGTLDPLAVGVLPVCVGKATKVSDMITDFDKEYKASFMLGVTTDTEDISGSILKKREVAVSENDVINAVKSFVGEYHQIPPMYSAVKISGKRLYQLARKGIEVERKPRRVFIYDIKILNIDLKNNIVEIVVLCSKGTYIRTLCKDIGEKLLCGAVMTALERTKSGIFTKENSISLEDFKKLCENNEAEKVLLPVDSVFSELEKIVISNENEKRVRNGNYIITDNVFENQNYRIYNQNDEFLAIYKGESLNDKIILSSVKNFFEV